MADELALQCSSLRLNDDEGGLIDVGDIECEETDEKLALLLVGKLLTERPYNIETFKRTMAKVWATSNNLIIRVLGPNFFSFQFFHWRDKEKVMNGRPWCWENNLLVLREVDGNEQPENITINLSPFWVRVCKLPFNCRSNGYVKALTADLGDFMEIEDDILGLERYRRIRVMLDISRPLRRYQWMNDRSGNEVKVEYKYERLPYFCLACGIIGHSERDCVNVADEDKKKKLGWELSLRASPRKGHMRESEELAQITATRRQLFVSKEVGSSIVAPILLETDVSKGVDTTIDAGKQVRVIGDGSVQVGETLEEIEKVSLGGLKLGDKGGIVRKASIYKEGMVQREIEKGDVGGSSHEVAVRVTDVAANNEKMDNNLTSLPTSFNVGLAPQVRSGKYKKIRREGVDAGCRVSEVEEEFRCGKRKDCMDIDSMEDDGKRSKSVSLDGLVKVAAVGAPQPREYQ